MEEPRKIFARLSDNDKFDRFMVMSRKIAQLERRVGELKKSAASCHKCSEIQEQIQELTQLSKCLTRADLNNSQRFNRE